MLDRQTSTNEDILYTYLYFYKVHFSQLFPLIFSTIFHLFQFRIYISHYSFCFVNLYKLMFLVQSTGKDLVSQVVIKRRVFVHRPILSFQRAPLLGRPSSSHYLTFFAGCGDSSPLLQPQAISSEFAQHPNWTLQSSLRISLLAASISPKKQGKEKFSRCMLYSVILCKQTSTNTSKVPDCNNPVLFHGSTQYTHLDPLQDTNQISLTLRYKFCLGTEEFGVEEGDEVLPIMKRTQPFLLLYGTYAESMRDLETPSGTGFYCYIVLLWNQ